MCGGKSEKYVVHTFILNFVLSVYFHSESPRNSLYKQIDSIIIIIIVILFNVLTKKNNNLIKKLMRLWKSTKLQLL